MLLRHFKTDGQKGQRLQQGLFVFLCLLTVGFTGCQSESEVADVMPAQAERAHLAQIHNAKDLQANGFDDTLGTLSSLDQSVESAESILQRIINSAETKETKDILPVKPQIPPARRRTVTISPKGMAHLLGQGLDITDVNTAVEQTAIDMPLINKSGMTDELISVNFENVDIRTMLKTVGDITGINFVVDDSVSGTVTVMSPTRIRLSELYGVLESILEVKGYAAVPAGDQAEGLDGIKPPFGRLVKIVPRAKAAQRNLNVRIGSDPSDIAQSDSVITQILPLSYADATDVSQIIQPLLATGSHMAIYPRTNSIVITDTSSNIHHVAKVIQKLDIASSEEQVTVISLMYASAKVLGEQITRIMEKNESAASANGRSRGTAQVQTDIKILADVRTNSLIVTANAQDTHTIEQLIENLDVERPNRASNVHVVYLKNAQAEETAKSLTAALSNLKIAGALESTSEIQLSADVGTNSLIITASAQDYEVIADIIEKLDIVREQVLVEHTLS